MKIIQLMPTIAYGDAVSNDALAIYEMLSRQGFKTAIYGEHIDPRITDYVVRNYDFEELTTTLEDEDIILYHGSTGSKINEYIPYLPGKKILRYHNVTPAEFFHPYAPAAEQLTADGIMQFESLNEAFHQATADSSFNRENLIDMGYRCRIDVCPILIPFDDYKKKPDEDTIDKYRDGVTNLLFVGRIAPNKKQEDIIASFYVYQKLYNPDSRLFLAGSWNGMERYYHRLVDYVKELGLTDKVIFTGHISFAQILALYRVADLFLCLSEHEGFCVPLVEAMYFRVPIVAYDSCAVGETLGNAGVLVPTKKPEEVAAVAEYVLSDEELLDTIKKNQVMRLRDFSHENIETRLMSILMEHMEERDSIE